MSPRNRHLDAFRVPRRVVHVHVEGDADDMLAEAFAEVQILRGVSEYDTLRADAFEAVAVALVAGAWDESAGDIYCRWCGSTADVDHDEGCPVGLAEQALADDRGGGGEGEA